MKKALLNGNLYMDLSLNSLLKRRISSELSLESTSYKDIMHNSIEANTVGTRDLFVQLLTVKSEIYRNICPK